MNDNNNIRTQTFQCNIKMNLDEYEKLMTAVEGSRSFISVMTPKNFYGKIFGYEVETVDYSKEIVILKSVNAEITNSSAIDVLEGNDFNTYKSLVDSSFLIFPIAKDL